MSKQGPKKNTWGGPRRPPSKDPAVGLSISLPTSLCAEIERQAYGRTGESRSEVIARLVRAGLKAEKKKRS